MKGTTAIAAAASVFSSWASLWKAAAGLSLGAVTQRWLQPSPCTGAGGPCVYPDTIATHMGVRLEGQHLTGSAQTNARQDEVVNSKSVSCALCRAMIVLINAQSRKVFPLLEEFQCFCHWDIFWKYLLYSVFFG